MPAVPPATRYVENPDFKPDQRLAVAVMETTGTAGPIAVSPAAAYPAAVPDPDYDASRTAAETYAFGLGTTSAPAAAPAQEPADEPEPPKRKGRASKPEA